MDSKSTFYWVIPGIVLILLDVAFLIEGACESGWTENPGNGQCYKYIATPMTTYTDGVAACQAVGGVGAFVTSKAENDWLTKFCSDAKTAAGGPAPMGNGVRLGGRRKGPNNADPWNWVTGVTECPFTYTNWSPNDGPAGTGDGADGSAVYLVLNPGFSGYAPGIWWDWPEENKMPIVCQRAPIGLCPQANSCAYKPGDCKPTPTPTPPPPKSDCLNIKKDTLLAILENCGCEK